MFIEQLLETLSMGNTLMKDTFLEEVFIISHNMEKKGTMFKRNKTK